MLVTKPYIRENAVAYARKFAFSQNSNFASFAGIGGNCTNFVSQCIYAGSCQMNYKPTFGWYFISLDDRSPSWTGVEYFYNFIITIIFLVYSIRMILTSTRRLQRTGP